MLSVSAAGRLTTSRLKPTSVFEVPSITGVSCNKLLPSSKPNKPVPEPKWPTTEPASIKP